MYFGKVINKLTGAPVIGVPVSDGKNITLTDIEGNYSLAGYEKSNTVAVYCLTNCHSDWFHYTGGKQGEYNFEITPAKQTDNGSFLHTSDTEIHEREVIDWIPFAKDCADKYSPAFLMHTGDICRKAGLEKHYKIMNYDTVGVPVRYAIGNHDFCEGDYGEQLFEKLYGPVWYAFDVENVHFIVMSIGKGEKPTGYTLDNQWDWLRNDLELVAKDRPVIILDHDSNVDVHTFLIETENGTLDLKKYNILAWVFGHYHTNYHHVRGNIANICTTCPDCGGIDSSAAGIRLIKVSDNKVTSEMIYNGLYRRTPDKSVWQTKLDGFCEYAKPVIYQNDVIAATMTEGYPTDCGVYRLCGNTGKIKWKFKTKYGVKNQFAVSDGKIYAQDSAGYLYCIDAKNGTLLFEVFIKYERWDFSRQSVLCVKDKIFTGGNKDLYAFDKNSGKQLWHLTIPKGSATAAKLVYDEKNDRVLYSVQWYYIFSVDAKTGEIVWQNNDILVWHRNSTPTIYNGKIYTCSETEIGALCLDTGEVISKAVIPSEHNTVGAPVIDDGLIYFPTAKSGVVAYDVETYEIKKTFPCGHSKLFTTPYIYNVGEIQMVESSPVIMDDALIFSASDGAVYFYDKKSEKLLRKINLEGPALTSPVFLNGNIIVCDFFGNVYNFSKNQ